MRTTRRSGLTLLDLLVVLAVLAILAGLLLPAVQKVREAAARSASMNNLKQIGLAVHNYASTYNFMPPGVDANDYSAHAHMLPFIEQENVFKLIDFKKRMDAKDNDQVRAIQIKIFLSPRDEVQSAEPNRGATNYVFLAGTNPDLAKNNGMFYRDSKTTFAQITDGTSNTVMTAETLKGNGLTKPVTVQRQHVRLKAADLAGLKEGAGAAEWKAGKAIAGDRCASWLDGRFLQSTFTGTLKVNDERPDVDCGGAGGFSALRAPGDVALVGLGDGSVRTVSARRLTFQTWQNAVNRHDGNVLGQDW
jgi:type II secretory pathway pseudopilin PulG